MTAEQFNRWLDEMKDAGIVRFDIECGKLLGVSANAIVIMKRNGTDRRTALACAALLRKIPAYA